MYFISTETHKPRNLTRPSNSGVITSHMRKEHQWSNSCKWVPVNIKRGMERSQFISMPRIVAHLESRRSLPNRRGISLRLERSQFISMPRIVAHLDPRRSLPNRRGISLRSITLITPNFLELTKPERGISLWKQKPGVIHNWTNWTVEDSDILEVLYHGKLITVWLDYHTVKRHRGSNRRTKQDCVWSLGEGKDPKSSQAVRLSFPSGEARTRLPTHLHTKGAILNLTVKDLDILKSL